MVFFMMLVTDDGICDVGKYFGPQEFIYVTLGLASDCACFLIHVLFSSSNQGSNNLFENIEMILCKCNNQKEVHSSLYDL